jgi:hypothetical protein
MGGAMSRTEIVEIAMPDGTVINAEVLVSSAITDVGAQRRLRLGEAKESIAAFVRWAVGSLDFSPADGTDLFEEPGASPPRMSLSRVELEFGLKIALKAGTLTSVIAAVGGEATAVVRLEWERSPGTGGDQ